MFKIEYATTKFVTEYENIPMGNVIYFTSGEHQGRYGLIVNEWKDVYLFPSDYKKSLFVSCKDIRGDLAYEANANIIIDKD